MTRLRSRTESEDGFTLIELLVTMTLALVVLFAILDAGDRFNAGASNADQATEAQETARRTLSTMVATLRQGRVAATQTSPVTGTPSRSDLVVAAHVSSATSAAPGDVPGWVRYCAVTTGGRSSLVVGVRTSTGYVPPGPCAAGSTTDGWHHVVVIDSKLLDPDKLFDFSSTACNGASCLPAGPDVQSVGIRLAVARNARGATDLSSVLRDAVSFRNRSST